MNFGDRITEIRVNQNRNLRTFLQDLKNNGSTLTSDQYSKIERGIQNPRNFDEFMIIIKTLGLTDSSVINDLEKLALDKSNIPPSKESDYLPIFVKGNKTAEELEHIAKFLQNSDKPDW